MRKFLALFMVVVFAASYAPCVLASGFYIYHQDTKAQGQAGAFTAQADNPSAIYYNPAGMSQLKGTQFNLGTRIFRLETNYKDSYGNSEDLEAKWQPVPSVFLTSDFTTEKWTFGLGVFAPYGLSTKWSGDGLLRYCATKTSFNMIDINPSISYKFCPEFSLGAGVDYYNVYSYVSEVKQNFMVADANTKLDVDGDGWGFNLGALWKPHPKHNFGLAFRSAVDVELTGSLKTEDIPTVFGLPPVISYGAKTNVNLPATVTGGYAFRPTEKLKLEADISWVQFSNIDKAEIKDRDTGELLSYINKDWNDTWIFALGGEYLINDNWSLRAGYSYQQNAVPEKTFNPSVPDANMNVVALGLGYNKSGWTIDVAYAIGLYSNRDIETDYYGLGAVLPDASGKYDSLIHIIGVSVGYAF